MRINSLSRFPRFASCSIVNVGIGVTVGTDVAVAGAVSVLTVVVMVDSIGPVMSVENIEVGVNAAWVAGDGSGADVATDVWVGADSMEPASC